MLRITLLLVLIAILTPVSSFEDGCPAIEDIRPCFCRPFSTGSLIEVDCMSVTSAEDVRQALSSTKDHKNVMVTFTGARMDKVPSDLFKGLHVISVAFTHCDLKSYGDEGRSALEGLEYIVEGFTLDSSFSEENELKFLNVSDLKAITHLELKSNNIRKMGNEWFRDGPISLEFLLLYTNSIEELGDKAFANLFRLKALDLTGNRFKIFRRSMLPSPAPYLRSLDLIDNGISSLPEDMFSNMPSLEEVTLTKNAIARLPESTWSPVWRQITKLYLQLNPLDCDSHIEWMFKVRRPPVVKGKCVSPSDRKNQGLKRIIDENLNPEEEDEDY